MTVTVKSPLIYQYSPGTAEIEKAGRVDKDVLLFPGGSTFWSWKEEGRTHEDAIDAELLDCLAAESEVIVLGLGSEVGLKVSPEALSWVSASSRNVFLAATHQAVKRYNDLAQAGKKVSLALHLP